MAASASALHIEYDVKAEFLGRPAPELPAQLGKGERDALVKNMKAGLTGSAKARVYSSESYSVMPSIIPDWTKMRLGQRINGWDDKVFFCTQAGLSTLGGTRALTRYIPHGQRLLLAAKTPPAQAYADLKAEGLSSPTHLAAINGEGNRAITWNEDHLTEEIVFKGGKRKYAEYRLVQGTALEIKRFHPTGRLLSVETWKPSAQLSESSRPVPTWENWQVGAWVMDERDTSQPMHKKWQGYGKEPLSGDAQPIRATTFKMVWMAPGALMLMGGIGLLVYQTVKRKPRRLGARSKG